MKNKTFILAIDQGSSSTKAAAFGVQNGCLAAFAKTEVNLNSHQDRCEYKALDLLTSTQKVIEEILNQIPAAQISEIAISAQRSTIVFWDKITGKALAPALSWLDGRAKAETLQNPLTQEFVHQKTGLYKTPYFSAPKIVWGLNNFPEVKNAFKEGRLCVGPVTSYLIWHLSGGKIFACDYACAQRTLLFNINTFTWDEEILKSFGLTADILPQVTASTGNFGTYKNIKITVSTGDQQAACAACGVLEKGSALINYGTGAFFLLNIGHKNADVKGVLTSLAWSRPQREPYYLLEAPLNTAGSFISWLKNLGLNFNVKKLDKIFESSKNPVWCLPALGGIGAPYFDFGLKPVFANFLPSTQKEDIIAGSMRGIVLLLCDIIYYLKQQGYNVETLQTSGGLSGANLIAFQAAILGCDILQNKQKESTLTGTALIAALGEGFDISAWRELKNYETISPRLTSEEAAKIYKTWREFFAWSIKQVR
ncbi:MAG: hypothetical protein K6E94_06410 [Elusimicrobiaceae bacterium]|nr:hypothetical protein [Elusimicrobiaceae bacterium]